MGGKIEYIISISVGQGTCGGVGSVAMLMGRQSGFYFLRTGLAWMLFDVVIYLAYEKAKSI